MWFFCCLWVMVGAVASISAIAIFRPDGSTRRKYELYLAVAGVLLGFVTLIILGLDLAGVFSVARKARKVQDEQE